MSVCMSAVSAGISEVLIKYTGNVWLQKHFFLKLIKNLKMRRNVKLMIATV